MQVGGKGGKGGKTTLPSLGRKWINNRWSIVLKVPKWDKGIMLMCETPLAICCSYQRPMGNTPQQEESDEDLKNIQQRESAAVLQEMARVKRWVHAMKLKWTPEEVLLYEVLLYCKDHQPGKNKKENIDLKEGASGPTSAPPVMISTVDVQLDKYLKSAEWLLKDRAFDYLFKEDRTTRENLLSVLLSTSISNYTMFSQKEKGLGWYPLLGHLKQVGPDMANQINACICFQNSNAYLFPLTDLRFGDEIVISNNSDDIKQLKLLSTPSEIKNFSQDSWYQLSRTVLGTALTQEWQLLAKLVAEFGKPILDRMYDKMSETLNPDFDGDEMSIFLPRQPMDDGKSTTTTTTTTPTTTTTTTKVRNEKAYFDWIVRLQESVNTFLRMQWLISDQKPNFGLVPDLVRIEFLLIYLHQLSKLVTPPTPPASTSTPSTSTLPAVLDNVKNVQSVANGPVLAVDVKDVKTANGSNVLSMPELEDFLDSLGIDGSIAKLAPAVKSLNDQLAPDEWQLYNQIVMLANRRLMIYDLLPVLQNDSGATAYHQLWYNPKIVLPGNIVPPISLLERWNAIATKLGKPHPDFLDKD